MSDEPQKTIHQRRIDAVRRRMVDEHVDALWVRAESNRFYLTGFTGTQGEVLLTRSEQWLIVDGRYVEQAKMQAPAWTIVSYAGGEGLSPLVQTMRQSGSVTFGYESAHVTVTLFDRLRQLCAEWAWTLVPLEHVVESVRSIKDSVELACMRRAVAIAEEALAYGLSLLTPGKTEREIAWAIEQRMRQAGASGVSFDLIVASGERSALPHGVASDRVLRSGEWVTIDCGARFERYCSDMTRTVFLGTGATVAQRRMYEAVLDAQQRTIEALRPGMTGKEADAIARTTLASYGMESLFVHGTGHAVGIDIHERPALNAREQQVLACGHVVTVEPGVYEPGRGGIRIEDMVLMTETGCDVLTSAPKQWHDIVYV